MKKVLSLILAVMLFLAAGNAVADVMKSPDSRVKTAVWAGISGPTSSNSITLSSLNRIVGWKVSGDGAAGFAGLYDTDALGTATATTLFDEMGCSSDTTEPAYPWYAAPKDLDTGLTVLVDAATTVVIVYYE